MGAFMQVKQAIKECYPLRWLYFAIKFKLPIAVFGEEKVEKRTFKSVLGYEPDRKSVV